MRVRISEIREAKGIAQGELAEMVGISRPLMNQIENGKRNLSVARAAVIADKLGVHASDLVDYDAPNSDDEERLVKAFRSMSRAQREKWLEWADITLATGDPKED